MWKKFKEWYAYLDTIVSSKQSLVKRVVLKENKIIIKDEHEITISIAQLAHIDALVTLQRLAYQGQVPWHRSALIKDMMTNPSALYLIAMDEKQIPVGFIGTWMMKQEAHITNICVAPTHQGWGIGSELIRVMEEVAIAEGMTQYTLELRVTNTDAYRLYQHLGFKEVGVKRHYYLDDGEDAIDMCKELFSEQFDKTRTTRKHKRLFKEVPKSISYQQIFLDIMGDAHAGDIFSADGVVQASNNPHCHFFLVYENDIPVACALVSKIADECELYFIGVRREKQRQGLGSLMLKNIIEWCEEKEVQSFYLEVRESNTAALRLYETYDFNVISVRQNYYANPREDALIMNRKIKGGKNV